MLPFIEDKYAVLKDKKGRFLVGFSKSGWGAITLILRNPGLFYKVAGWDVGIRVDTGPISEEEREERIKRIFGDRQTFEAYRISNLLKERGRDLGEENRIFYYNTGGKRAYGGMEIHKLMLELEIPHHYLFEPQRKHRWDSGWIPIAVEFLLNE